MSKKRTQRPKASLDPTGDEESIQKGGLNRRNFLGLAGAAAASPLLVNPLSANSLEKETAASQPQETASDTCSTCPVPTPATAPETWDEPWVWKPHMWPGETLHLNVIEHQTPSTVVGLGNPGAALFAYNGATPGPTIRMKGDETLRVKLFNHLGLNQGSTVIGKAVDTAWFADNKCTKGADLTKYKYKCDWELGEHLNGIHAIHTTNLHTHGLHVRPGLNTDGTHSDNIYLRVIPQADLIKRETDPNYNGNFLLEGEQAGEAQYEFRLGEAGNQKIAKHPPGTHWYHPHSHGSTNMEVASGMAGFLVVEGDVDEKINEYMTGIKEPDTTLKTGKFGYRERLMMVQRIQSASKDQDSDRVSLKSSVKPSTNGSTNTDTIVMSPGDVERWRVLNGSIDGKGYMRFMVLEGQWVSEAPAEEKYLGKKRRTALKNIQKQLNSTKQLLFVSDKGERCLPSTKDIEERKQHLYQLAQDGVTLVRKNPTTGKAEYYIKDLGSEKQKRHKNPLYQDYSNLEACYKDATTLKACYNLPNELYMAPANRADFFFQAPKLKKGEKTKIYTVIGKGTAIHTENEQRKLGLANHYINQPGSAAANLDKVAVPQDTIIAYIVVRNPAESTGETCKNQPNKPVCNEPITGPDRDFSMTELMSWVNEVPVPEYLHPIEEKEVKVQEHDVDHDKHPGKYRTRRITYSGWGSATWPRLATNRISKLDPSGPTPEIDDIFKYNPAADGVNGVEELVSPPATRTMGIDGKKFNPDDHMAPKPLLGTAEEWSVYNNSISLWHKYPALSSLDMDDSVKGWYVDHLNGHPVDRHTAKTNEMGCSTRGIDHPFHIHTNPFWLLRIEVPDDKGNYVNILEEPRWQDVIWLPRNGGRVIFRARFPDYVGKMVNHCHILQHEDNGMMQEVEITQSVKAANYEPANAISNENMTEKQVNSLGGVFVPVGLHEAYRECSRVVDRNHMDSPDLPLAYEFPAVNGVFDPPPFNPE